MNPALILTLVLPLISAELPYSRGLTPHFISWLNDTGLYEPYGFNKTLVFGGSFGGRESDDDRPTRRPVVFVHGTADSVIGDNWKNNGFRATIEHFIDRGYTKAELYGSTWGWADYYHEFQHVYQQEYVMYIRKFIEAVLDYTGAEHIDVICHSMGVPLTRRALKGGWSSVPTSRVEYGSADPEERPFYIGKPLTRRVKHFIGIVGPNYGVGNCTKPEFKAQFRGCNPWNGFYPGSAPGSPVPEDLTPWLRALDVDRTREGESAFAFVSYADETIPSEVFGRFTAEYPTMNRSFHFSNFSHREARDLTTELQYQIINDLYKDEPASFL